eukprot:gb/GEZN01013112.1/.p1 GENE.gb/GEZN01013112.1/~~gb/GEZN01013112.1/.p1  ORF type:complete len:167 (-),score=14.95 gb/GEZN01013112.1/:278-778(-)
MASECLLVPEANVAGLKASKSFDGTTTGAFKQWFTDQRRALRAVKLWPYCILTFDELVLDFRRIKTEQQEESIRKARVAYAARGGTVKVDEPKPQQSRTSRQVRKGSLRQLRRLFKNLGQNRCFRQHPLTQLSANKPQLAAAQAAAVAKQTDLAGRRMSRTKKNRW